MGIFIAPLFSFHTSAKMESAARGVMLTLFLLLPVVLGANPYRKFHKDASGDIKCPDGGECPKGDTCCPTTAGAYGCCPDPNAVCCSDGKHCCPEGYQCDVSSDTCIKGTTVEAFLSLDKHVKNVKEVICPYIYSNGSYTCPNGEVCCPSFGGCCPSGEICNIPGGYCEEASLDCDKATGNCPDGAIVKTIDSPDLMKAHEITVEYIDIVKNDVKNVICPGSKYMCPDGNTCCPNSSGTYGCCPFPSAVCCSDLTHCCPSGYTCTSDGYCQKSFLSGLEDRIPF